MKIRFALLPIIALGIFFTALPRPANAGYCSPSTDGTPFPCIRSMDIDEWWSTQDFTTTQKQFLENNFYQQKIINELWKNNLRPALQAMTAQVIGTQVQESGMIGAMLDGQTMNDTQIAMQSLAAQAYRDYTPGENLCRIGTLTRSVAAAEQNENTTLTALDQISESRLMGRSDGQSGPGSSSDRQGRFAQFQRLYCNPGDNNGFMKELCYPISSTPLSQPPRFNKDIDVARTLDAPRTLDLSFTNGTLTTDEEDVLALSNNLYAHDIFDTVPPTVFGSSVGNPNMPAYLDLRQIAALRSVAQNSFNAIAAQKAKGAKGASTYMINVLREMGMSDAEASRYLSNSTDEPSYYAQMEILTKKLYQNPNFYAGLIDKPANVKRQIAAMKGIELTQNRDLFQSMERQELLISLLLELEVRAEQQRIKNDMEGTK